MPELIRYNDTQEYEYITCFTTYGVFTEKHIDLASLPTGFHAYYMTAGKDGIVSKIFPAHRFHSKKEVTGTFISKNKIPGTNGKTGATIDWTVDVTVHTDQEFHFEEYFGTPPSLDCQIESAYQRQELQIRAAKEKKRGKKQQEYNQNRGR